MRSSPPAARAVGPGDVEAETRRAALARAAVEHGRRVVRCPAPPSSTASTTRPPPAVTVHRVRRALGGVGEDVAREDVDRGGRLVRVETDEMGSRRLDRARPGAAVVVSQRSPEVGPIGCDLGQVAPDGDGLVQRPPRRPDQLADLGLEAIDVVDQRRGAVALGVEAERGQRGAEPVRQVGHPLALGREELVDAVGQEVERVGHILDLGRAARLGTGRGVASGERPAGAGQVGGRPRDAASQLVGGDDREDEEADGDHGEHGPRGRDALGELRLRDPHAEHDDVVRRPPAPGGTRPRRSIVEREKAMPSLASAIASGSAGL